MHPPEAHVQFRKDFARALEEAAADPEVVGFKSIVCYRTGLDVTVNIHESGEYFNSAEQCVTMAYLKYDACRSIRLEAKPLNDYVVNETLRVAGQCGKPGEQNFSYAMSASDAVVIVAQCSSTQDWATMISRLRNHRPR